MPEAQPVFLWTVKARRRLQSSLAGASAEPVMQRLNEILTTAFAGASVVIQDKMLGFRPRANQHILLVEVCGEAMPGAYVVKMGPVRKLEQEITGWRSCCPFGLRHDMVFLELSERHRDPPETPEPLLCLVYGDAQQFIGVAETLTLESAALDAVRLGVPTLSSVREVLVQLFERVGHLLYEAGREDDPEGPAFHLDVPRLEGSLRAWETQEPLLAIRGEVHNALLAQRGVERYLGAVPYLRHVAGHCGAAPPPYPPELPPPPRRQLVPAMLRGPAHGDLHGRNILVGKVRDRVLWPTVFDYGDMGPRNLLGWDFVKLETELKIRAHHALRTDLNQEDFIRRVHDFELELNEATERCHGQARWDLGGETEPLQRLRALLLQIRHLASIHLGQNRGRPRRWLEEYYFLLAAYGVHAGRFENLIDRELLALCISAGTAAARLSWPRQRLEQERAFLGVDLPRGAPALRRGAATAAAALALPTVSYDALLEKARAWIRSDERALHAEAVALLEGLFQRFPGALDLGPELALAQTIAGRSEDADKTLLGLQKRFRAPNEEYLCRWGRKFKEEGDRFFLAADGSSSPGLADAVAKYRQALTVYDKAYSIRLGHYPGINKATLLFLLGAAAKDTGADGESQRCLAEAEALANLLLAGRHDWQPERNDDRIWHLATAAEAFLIGRQAAEAATQYRQALKEPNLQEMHRVSMHRQVERILHAFMLLGWPIPAPFEDLKRLFAASSDDSPRPMVGPSKG